MPANPLLGFDNCEAYLLSGAVRTGQCSSWIQLRDPEAACWTRKIEDVGGQSAIGSYPEMGCRQKVNSLWLNLRLLIVLHSPYAPLETGLHICPPEKSGESTPIGPQQFLLSSPVC